MLADTRRPMAKEEPPRDLSGLGEVQLTVVVVPGRVRATLAKLLASARVRAGLVSGGALAVVVASAIIAASLSSGPSGTFASQWILTLHRVHGGWLREFEASRWTCPPGRLPERIALELHLCR